MIVFQVVAQDMFMYNISALDWLDFIETCVNSLDPDFLYSATHISAHYCIPSIKHPSSVSDYYSGAHMKIINSLIILFTLILIGRLGYSRKANSSLRNGRAGKSTRNGVE